MSLDPAEPKPELYAIVGWPLAQGHVLLTKQERVTLDEAEMFHRLGFLVLVDPESESILARWEQLNRRKRWTSW